MRLGVVKCAGALDLPGEFLTPKSALLQGQAGAALTRSQVELGGDMDTEIDGKTSINLASMSKGISDLPHFTTIFFQWPFGGCPPETNRDLQLHKVFNPFSDFPESFPIGLPSACKHCAHR